MIGNGTCAASGSASTGRATAGRAAAWWPAGARRRTASRERRAWRVCGVAVLATVALSVEPGDAVAGEFEVATCQADSMTFSTRAVEDFATRGMRIKRACNPEGPGLRGLVTSNVVTRGRVPRGSVALATITAPPGTRLATLRWAGTARRRDCGFSLQLFADAPDQKAISIKNVRAGRGCPKPGRAQAAGYRSRTYDITGATRVVQRVICVGDGQRRSCAANGLNFVRTYKASVRVLDAAAPSVAIVPDTPLTRGEWVRGAQPLTYDASDNVGVRLARALVGGRPLATHDRSCLLASQQAYGDRVPCPNGPGRIDLETTALPDGTQSLVIQAQDSAGNLADSPPVAARIDNTPPARVDVRLEGGDQWRNRNDFRAIWANPSEPDRAPIVAGTSELCPAGGSACARTVHAAPGIAGIRVSVPSPGEWRLAVWRRDAAGNEAPDNASVPVTLRYDPDPPEVAFESSVPSDPTLVAVRTADRTSGVAGGAIEIGPAGTGSWQTLPTELRDGRLTTRIDDATLPAGTYGLRARAVDHAGNENSTDRRSDGQPMVLNLPLRIGSEMRAGVPQRRFVRRTIRRNGERRRVKRPVTVLRSSARIELGSRTQIAGQLANRDGQGIAGAQIQVFSRTATTPEELVGVVTTDGEGRYRYTATGTSSRTLRLAYGGSPVMLPAQAEVRLLVPADSTLRVDRRRVLNGQAVQFSGRVKGFPLPPGGKLVEMQVVLSGRWQTFRTFRTDGDGKWAMPYRFRRTTGVQWYRFRARLPAEAGYPFEAGLSRPVNVRVRGL